MNKLENFLTYEAYRKLSGVEAISEKRYKALALEAFSFLNLITFKRLERNNLPHEVKNAITEALTEVVGAFYVLEEAQEKNRIEREKIGTHEVSYKTKGALSERDLMHEKERLAFAVFKRHLAHTGLFYRGR